jgi:uncharacterized protein (TIGR02646 family)
MKRITKLQPPHELIAWRQQKAINAEGKPMHWGYDDMPGSLRQKVKESLLREQGGICCYIGRRITLQTSHIEHLKPQSFCTNHEDTDYSNLLAAFPEANAQKECAYGARRRKNWYDVQLFIHPLRGDCESRFKYRFDGKVEPANPADKAAAETIDRLNLNDKELVNWRKEVIHAALFASDASKGEIQRLMGAMSQRDSNGNYRQFCFVIKQACERYLQRISS